MSAVRDPRLVIEVENLTAEGWSFEDDVSPARLNTLLPEDAEARWEAAAPLRADLSAYKAGDGLRLEGKARTRLIRPCDRCLRPTPRALALELGMTLFPAARAARVARPAGEETVLPGKGGRRKGRKAAKAEPEMAPTWDVDDVNTGSYVGGKVDVEDILREQILLELPVSHLCGEDCPGLCQKCGADLNEGPCGCPAARREGKFAALANFKIQ